MMYYEKLQDVLAKPPKNIQQCDEARELLLRLNTPDAHDVCEMVYMLRKGLETKR